MKNKNKKGERDKVKSRGGRVQERGIVTNQRPQSGSMKRTLYWVSTRELNRELCTEQSTFIY